MVLQLNAQDFEAEVARSSKPVVVDFWAIWCGPCRLMAPIFEDLSKKMEKVKFAKVNVDENQELAGRFGIMSIPTTILFKDGNPVDQLVGAVPPDALQKWIENRL